jgi:hypothetical protein
MNGLDVQIRVNTPAIRKLRAYAFDPSLSLQLDNAVINDICYRIPWEELKPGPVGEYVEVVDFDPPSDLFYKPVNLNDHYILAQDGLDPSESNPMFHQQMVYAVAMTTIKNFERALGRKIQWSSFPGHDKTQSEYVKRLRIYPHGLREPNAYYSPLKKSVLFGYFNSVPDNAGVMLPGSTVYCCLSHDIIAHEVTHALLDGMHRRYIEATQLDSLAFHEAFADIVALFQHFTFPEVLRAQIAKTRGDLSSENLLGQLAQEFGKAIGHYGSLRDALGSYNEKKEKWEPHKPDPDKYKNIKTPHERGSILVATIFDAFVNIYKKRIADLQRIATGGTGILPEGSLHPDLVNRMAKEAAKSANNILHMCVRALDYCPPVDISFGDYLRAIISADFDLVDNDTLNYRVAIIEAFQRNGIYPENLKNISVESLLLRADETPQDFETKFMELIDFFKLFKEKISYVSDRKQLYKLTKKFISGGDINKFDESTGTPKPPHQEKGLHARLSGMPEFGEMAGLILGESDFNQLGIGTSDYKDTLGKPLLEIHNLKLASRAGPDGKLVNQILVTLTQRRGVVCKTDEYGNPSINGFFIPDNQKDGWYKRVPHENTFQYIWQRFPGKGSPLKDEGSEKVLPNGWFIFRGGSTLIFDLDYATSADKVKLKYIIRKSIHDEDRMLRQYRMMFQTNELSLNATYFGSAYWNLEAEPFAIIHKVL